MLVSEVSRLVDRDDHEYLQAIPPHDDEGCTPGGP